MSASLDVAVVRTGLANLASVLAALTRAGAAPHLTESAREIESATAVVLPGVGAFAPAMRMLREHGLVAALRARVARGAPTLAVCLGMQLLLDGSSECPDGTEGLGVVPGRATRFTGENARVPQLGWNRIVPDPGAELLDDGYVYFANSYRLVDRPDGWTCAMADHGGPFVAALERGPVLCCQFHPELSSHAGKALLARWLEAARREAGGC